MASRAKYTNPFGMLRRFLAYGLAGWGLEVIFTGVTGLFVLGNRSARAQTYLWMLPIYGGGGLALESAQRRLVMKRVGRWNRALVYMVAIYGIEYACASLLERSGVGVPWKYERGLHLRGYVRLDYAPFWYGCGLLFELVAAEAGKLNRPARNAPRELDCGESGMSRRRTSAVEPVAPQPAFL